MCPSVAGVGVLVLVLVAMFPVQLSALSNWSPESLSQPLLSTGETPANTDQK